MMVELNRLKLERNQCWLDGWLRSHSQWY